MRYATNEDSKKSESLLAQRQEAAAKAKSERHRIGEQLVEKWSKKEGMRGDSMIAAYDSNPEKIRGLAIALENQEDYLSKLSEAVVSGTFQTTPQNVVRIIRLGYPNSVRGEIFLDYPMITAHDSMWYLRTTYGKTKRGATAGNVMHESSASRYPTEYEEESVGTGNASTTNFAGTLGNPPLRPFHVRILVDGALTDQDDGNGAFTNNLLTTASTINYTTGAYDITFTTAPATGIDITIVYSYDSEIDTQFDELGDVNIALEAIHFRATPHPLGLSWTKMTELLLGTTLGIDAEEALVTAGGQELKKSLDFEAVKFAYRYAKTNNLVEFNADFNAAGADSAVAHAQTLSLAIDQAGDQIFDELNRGGVTKLVGGSKALRYMGLHKKFSSVNGQPAIGIYKKGIYDGNIDVYKAPSSVIPTDELMAVWRNPDEINDAAIAFGTLVPLYSTAPLEFKEMYKEQGLAYFGDRQKLNSKYIVRIKINNVPN